MAAWLRLGGAHVGSGLQVESGATIRWGGHPGIHIGDGVRLGRGVVLDVPEGGALFIGDGVKVMHYTVIGARMHLEIGRGTQIAEHCTLRDSDHGGDESVPLADRNISSPTRVGRDVWLARGVGVLRGATVGDGAVVGANSVVIRKYPVAAGARVVGAPAK